MIDLLITSVSTLLSKVIPDVNERQKLAHEIATMAQKHAHENAIAQIEVNKVEAQHSSIFVAGWRPFIAWCCGIGLCYNFILYPLLLWIVAFYQINMTPPPLFSDNLMELVMGILGLGAMRTYEKFKGVERNKI
jgi:hypothetical protein